MGACKAWGLGLAALLLSGCLSAPPAAPLPPGGVPGAGAAPGAAGAPGAGAAAAAAPPAAGASPPNLWSFLCPTPEQKQECRQKLCYSFLGRMLNSALVPLGMFTGGAVSPFCPQLSDLQGLTQPSDTLDGASARIKQDEAGVAKRREEVRYLSTVDCRYWPEAEAALIKALRADKSECVRLEAALGFQRGCCCSRPVLEALVLTASGGDKDGFPAERSERVKAAALQSLHLCLARCDTVSVTPVAPAERPEKPTPPEKPGIPERLPPPRPNPAARSGYYERLNPEVEPLLLEEARRLDGRLTPKAPPGRHSLLGLIVGAAGDPPSQSAEPSPAPGTGVDDAGRGCSSSFRPVDRRQPLAGEDVDGAGRNCSSIFRPSDKPTGAEAP
jgi:hypothetical protein